MSKAKAKALADIDDDNPPLDDATLARLRPAREVMPDIVNAVAKIGRPKSDNPKEAIKLRIDRDVLAYYRGTGEGWQTRINDALRKASKLKKKVG